LNTFTAGNMAVLQEVSDSTVTIATVLNSATTELYESTTSHLPVGLKVALWVISVLPLVYLLSVILGEVHYNIYHIL